MNTKTNKIVVSAMFLALAAILSMLKLFEMPFGGTVTVASMVPVVIIGYIYGTKWGLFSAFIYSILQLILGTATGIVSRMFLPGDEQMALWQAISICFIDYILAYLMLGLGGIFKDKFGKTTLEIVLGAVVSTVLCWVMHVISGYIFYGAWAEWFFGDSTGLSQIGAFKGFCDWVMANIHGGALALFYSAVYNAAYMLPETVITAALSPVVYTAVKKSVKK